MKKLFAAIVVVVMVMASVFTLVACQNSDNSSEVEKAIAAAEKMSVAELEKAAEEEFTAKGIKFTAQASTSGVGKALAKFKETYTWFDYAEFSSSKDSASFKALEETVAQGNWWADFTMLQVGAKLQPYIDAGYLLNYIPNDSGITLDEDDQNPLVGIYADKLFMYNKSASSVTLENVWQLTGKDGAQLKAMPGGVSIQDPTNELINMSFFAQLTSDASVAKLKSSYKNYFGTDYQDSADYPSIAYYFISEFIGNVKNRHSSDSKVLSETIDSDTSGFVFVVGLNKTKGYPEEKNWQDDLAITCYNGNNIDGFDGFTYKTYITIPKTSKLPYTACLFARYILTEEGFKAGWKDLGYNSPNSQVSRNEVNGIAYGIDKEHLIVEDSAYVSTVFSDVSKYVQSLWTK